MEMPITREVYERVLQTLESVRPVTARKMFGGAGFYVDGVFFAILDDDRLFFKVDDATLPDYEHFGSPPWVWDGNISDNYRELPAEILGSEERLGEWIDASVQAAIRLKASSKGKKTAKGKVQ